MIKLLYFFVAFFSFFACKKDYETNTIRGSWEITNAKEWIDGEYSGEQNFPTGYGWSYYIQFSNNNKFYGINTKNGSVKYVNQDIYSFNGNTIKFSDGYFFEFAEATVKFEGDNLIITFENNGNKDELTFKKANYDVKKAALENNY